MKAPALPRWEFEDELTPIERAEALATFKPGKLRGAVPRRHVTRYVSDLPVTKLEKLRKPEPIITPLQVAAGGAILIGAFFAGRWWARREKAKKPVGKVGIDVFAAS